jgi:hypothetical protein
MIIEKWKAKLNTNKKKLRKTDNQTKPKEKKPHTHTHIQRTCKKKNEVSQNKNMATSENAPNWAKDFLQELSSGAINSTTKAKDQATKRYVGVGHPQFLENC